MRSEWPRERFSKDWDTIREGVVVDWAPEATSTLYGRSLDGFYEQVTFRLGQDCFVRLTSIHNGEEMQISHVTMRIPNDIAPPEKIRELTNRFVNVLLSEDFDAAAELFVPAVRTGNTTDELQFAASLLAPSEDATRRDYHRSFANGVWRDAVQLTRKNDPMTYLLIVMSDDTDPPQILNLSMNAKVSADNPTEPPR